MRFALCQINPLVGAIEENTKTIEQVVAQVGSQADVLVFPELAVPGYPPTDAVFRDDFRSRCGVANEQLVRHTADRDIILVFGTMVEADTKRSARWANGAIVARGGEIIGTARKKLLPTYAVYDEARFFEPGHGAPCVVDIGSIQLGIAICEDFWLVSDPTDFRCYGQDPGMEMKKQGANLLINLSASPWHRGKVQERDDVVASVAQRTGLPILYCNLVGGNDDLIFDGRSLAWNPAGEQIARAKPYQKDILILEAADDGAITPSFQNLPPEIEDDSSRDGVEALALGLRDFCQKCGVQSVLVGLSGGIDSAVTASLAVYALGASRVKAVSMPSSLSSDETQSDAATIAKQLGIAFETIPIAELVKTYTQVIETATGVPLSGLPLENLQARLRGVLLMALSNRDGSLVLATGNKSELATGYCTLYGDMVGGLAVLGDLLKHEVYAAGRALDEVLGQSMIPESVYRRAPTAELSPNQRDSDSLPPYDVLDEFVHNYIVHCQSPESAAPPGLDGPRWARVIERMDFKRHQAPPILRVSARAFGRGRQTMVAKG